MPGVTSTSDTDSRRPSELSNDALQQRDELRRGRARAVSITSAWSSGCGSTPAAMLVMHEMPSTSIPMCRATIASGTVDMPTASAPIVRR